MPVRTDDRGQVERVSSQASHATEGLAPTAVAERVSDEDDDEEGAGEDATKSAAVRRRLLAKSARDGYCQCQDLAVLPASVAGDVVDRRPVNLCRRDFRAVQRAVIASKLVPVSYTHLTLPTILRV